MYPKGQGTVTTDLQKVKADTLVSRFVSRGIGCNATAEEVTVLVTKAAEQLQIPSKVLDHAIWQYMSAPRKD